MKKYLQGFLIGAVGLTGVMVQGDVGLAKEKEKVSTEQKKIEDFTKQSSKILQSLMETNDKLKMLNTKVYIVSYDRVKKDITHEVSGHETLNEIAEVYGINETTLAMDNELEPTENGFKLKKGQKIEIKEQVERVSKEIFLNEEKDIKDEIKSQKLLNPKVESEMSHKKYTQNKNNEMSSEIKDKVEAQIGVKSSSKELQILEEKQRKLEEKLEKLREKERKQLIASGLSEKEAKKQQLSGENSNVSSNFVASSELSPELNKKYQKSLAYAETLLGVPYVFGGTSEFGIDCSGYIYKSYNAGGIPVPRTTAEGFYNMSDKISNPKVGDLVFFSNTYRAGISHIGIYIGDGKMINAGGDYVHIADITKGYWADHFTGFGRLSQLNK